MADVVLGVAKSLVEGTRIRLRSHLLSGVSSGDLQHLRSEPSNIRAEIDICCETSDNTDDQTRDWVAEARELAYDMDDWFGLFDLRIHYGDGGGNPTSFAFVEWLRGRRDIADKLHDLVARLNALKERRPCSTIDARAASIVLPTVNCSRSTTHLIDTERLVGLAVQMDEVTKMVDIDFDYYFDPCISIVGMRGSGKTTLAAMVYQRLGERHRFQRRAFVSVGQKFDVLRILNDMLSQLGNSGNRESMDSDKLRASLVELLDKGRYLIVVDDLWSIEQWEIITHNFPHNELGSRIIITTRNRAVAEKCRISPGACCIYDISMLSDADSKELFRREVSATGHACPEYSEDIWDQIITGCGGLPLALVSLAARYQPSWDEREMLGFNLPSGSLMDGVKQMLNLRYNNLPLHLKACLLYLSIFSENNKVEVKRLLRQWIAEGFIISVKYGGNEKIAEYYLNELISTNMVQLLHLKNHGGPSRYCSLHPLMHDFIVSKSMEENFVTIVDSQHQNGPIHHRTIRRLSLWSSEEQDEAQAQNVTRDLSRARSVTVFGHASATPRLTDLLFVCVLDLEGCSGPVCLDDLLNLRLLRYLSLRGTEVSELPAKMGVLRLLQTLDIGYTKVKELPRSIGALKSLMYLSIRGSDVRELPETIGKLRELHTLDVRSKKVTRVPGSIDSTETRIPEAIRRCYGLKKLVTVDLSGHLPGFIESLGDLGNMRVIAITWSFHQCTDEAYRAALLSSIERWTTLTSLTIHCGLGCSMEFLGSLSHAPRHLQKFKVTAGRFARVPEWISKLKDLLFVQITICKQGTGDLSVLGGLPKLQCLILGLDFITEKAIVIESGWFPELQRFSVECPMPWFSFSTGSMQKLTYLQLKLCPCPVSKTSGLFGFGNLQSIAEVDLCYNPWEMLSPNISITLGAMTKAVLEHTNQIKLFINGVQNYDVQVAEEEVQGATGTRGGTEAGNNDDVRKIDEAPVNTTKRVQSTTEIEEVESDE